MCAHLWIYGEQQDSDKGNEGSKSISVSTCNIKVHLRLQRVKLLHVLVLYISMEVDQITAFRGSGRRGHVSHWSYAVQTCQDKVLFSLLLLFSYIQFHWHCILHVGLPIFYSYMSQKFLYTHTAQWTMRAWSSPGERDMPRMSPISIGAFFLIW